MFLQKITHPKDIQHFCVDELYVLSEEVRSRILEVLAQNGGHLASNLGIVELTIALHYCFSSPDDAFIFDTSHQTYAHKLLTGRQEQFTTLRQHKGISGFASPVESPHDHFFSGHAGTALSLALGMAQTRKNIEQHVIPILGDASFTCGLILEALNHIPKNLQRFLIILNDNNMAISYTVGNIRNILSRFINNPTANKAYHEVLSLIEKIPALGPILASQGKKIKESVKNLINNAASFFEHFGLAYIGPIDGHDIRKMIDTFSKLKNINQPTLVHVITKKGKGLDEAEANPTPYHGVKPFYNKERPKTLTTFPKEFGKILVEMAQKDPSLHVVCPAMIEGSCLTEFQKLFPDRCYDVGIAEGHCITYAGGMSYNRSLHIVISVYSSFLQRGFDNLFHDICMQNFPVIFAIDRAALSGQDGISHHGIYDMSFLMTMPNLIIAQPRDGQLLQELLSSAFSWEKPVAIRYPNKTTPSPTLPLQKRKPSQAEILAEGSDILLISVGHMVDIAYKVREILEKENLSCCIVDPIFIKPFDEKLFSSLLEKFPCVATIEEHSLIGGFASLFNSFVVQKMPMQVQILNYGIPDIFVHHGSSEDLLQEIGLDAKSIAEDILLKVKQESIIL